MTKARPQMGPAGAVPSVAGAGASGAAMPTATPPPSAGSAAAKGDCGCGAAAAGYPVAPSLSGNIGETVPSIIPAEAVGAGISAWQSNKRIIGLFSTNHNRNSWVYIDGIGWKKLVDNSDSAIMALTMLGAHAREKASAVNYREESDNKIYEMYVF